MKYKFVHSENDIEYWTGAPSTRLTSNFYLLNHEDKLSLGWELVEEVVIPPTEQSLQDYKTTCISSIKNEASNFLFSKYPPYKQINAALGIYDAAKTQEIVDEINRVRLLVENAESQTESAETKQDVPKEVRWL